MPSATSPLSRQDIDDAIAKYAPILHLHPEEQFTLCSIEWFLQHTTLVDNVKKTEIVHPTMDQLPTAPKEEKRYNLKAEDSIKAGDISTAKVYVHGLWQTGLAYTDLQFWFFYGFNGPASASVESWTDNNQHQQGNIDLKPMGEHYADWEYATIRIDNVSKEMIAIILSEHGKGIVFNKDDIKKKFKFENTTHPVVYPSLNGHANFEDVGLHPMHNVTLGIPKKLGFGSGIEFNLLNATAEGGKVFDCSKNYQVVSADWITGASAYPVAAWVKYPYRWGPVGTTINLSPSTVSDFLKAALGAKGYAGVKDELLVLLASELLPILVKSNMDGVMAPATQPTWLGHY